MSASWLEILAAIAVQHLWQSVLLLLLAWSACKRLSFDANARSWIWLCAFALAALLPLAVLLPGDAPAAVMSPASNGAAFVASAHGNAAQPAGAALSWATALASAAVLTWLLGSAWNLLRLLASWNRARRLRRTACTAPALEYLLADELPRHAGIKLSELIASPMVVGLLRPCILVPRTLPDELPPAALRDLLRHEIAHVRRCDLPVTFVQCLVLAIYWWSPLRWIAARLDLAREMACDEDAAHRSGDGSAYARALLAGVDTAMALAPQPRALVSGVFDTRRNLARRVEGLLALDVARLRCGLRPVLMSCATVFAISLTLTLAAAPRLGRTSASADAADAVRTARLVAAAEAGELDEIQRLVHDGVDVDAPLPGEGTALIVASRSGNLGMVEALLGLGASPDLASLRDGNPLIAAAQAGHHEVVDALIAAGANVNAVVRYDETPLINAARAGHFDIVQCLVEKGADVNLGVRADFGLRSPLNQARDDTIRAYLIRMGARSGST